MASTNEIYSLYLAYFGRPPDAVGFAAAQSKSVAALQSEFSASAESAALLGSTNLATQVNNIYVNAFGRSAETAGLLYWVGEIAANRVTLSQAAFTIVSSALGDDRTTVTNKITAATAFYAQVVASPANIIGYSGNAASAQARTFLSSVTSSAASVTAAVAGVAAAVTSTVAAGSAATVTPGSTFTLTNGADVVTGTAGNDTINALFSSTNGMTFGSNDSINGGAGNDVLSIQVGTTAIAGPASLTNVESVTANFLAAGTINLLNATGVTSIESNGSSAAATFSNIGSLTPTLRVSNTNQDTTFGYTATTVAGTADAGTIELNGVSGGTITIAGIENLTLNSRSAANVVTGITAANATTINVGGDQALNLGTLGNTVTTLNAGANTSTGAGVTAIMGAVAAATITGGTGNDDITIDGVTGNVSLAGGAGNDTVRVAANLTTTDTISGGDGTADVLRTTAAIAEGYVAPATRTITGFEQLTLTSVGTASTTLTTANVDTGINRVNLAGTAGAYGVTGPAGAVTVTTTAALGGTLTLTDTGTATTDSVTLTNSGVANANVLAGQNVTSTGYETLTINVGSGAATNLAAQTLGTVTMTPDTGGTGALVLTGGNAVSMGATNAASLNASALTGTTGVNQTAAATSTTITITGSGVADTLVGGSGNDTISGGAGNDSITGGIGVDSLTGGDGADRFVFGANTNATTYSSNAATTDVITDFVSGTDKIDIAGLTGGAATSFNGNFSNYTAGLNAMTANNQAFFVTSENNLYFVATARTGAATDHVIKLSGVTSIAAGDLLLGAQGTGNSITVTGGPILNTTTNTNASAVTTISDDTITAASGVALGNGVSTAAIDGGLGRDTFNATLATQAALTSLTTAGANTTSLALSNVEVVNLTVTATTAVVNLGTLPTSVDTLTVTGTDGNGALQATVGATGQSITVTNTVGTTASTITFGAFATQSATTGLGADTFNTIGVDGINVNGGAGDDTFNISNIAAFDNDATMITITGGTGTDSLVFANALTGTVNLADTDDVSLSGIETINAGTAAAGGLTITLTDSTTRTIRGDTTNGNVTYNATAAQLDALTTITAGAAGGTFSVAVSNTTGPVTVNLSDTTYTTLANVDSVTFNAVTTGVVTVNIDENLAVVGGQGTADVLNVDGAIGAVAMAASAFETVNFTADAGGAVTLGTGVATVNVGITQTGAITVAAATTASNLTAGNVTFTDDATTTAETFTNSGSGVMTVTLASDTTTADTVVNSGTGRVVVANAASTGVTTVTLNANSAIDSITFNDGGAGTVGVGSTTAANRVVVTGWNWAQDTITLDTFQTTVATAAAATVTLQVVNSAAATLLASGTSDVAIFNFDFGGAVEVLAGTTNGAAFLAHVGGAVTAAAGNADDMYIMAFDNGNWYLYAATNLTSAGVAAADLSLIGVFNGALNDVGAADFVLAN